MYLDTTRQCPAASMPCYPLNPVSYAPLCHHGYVQLAGCKIRLITSFDNASITTTPLSASTGRAILLRHPLQYGFIAKDILP